MVLMLLIVFNKTGAQSKLHDTITAENINGEAVNIMNSGDFNNAINEFSKACSIFEKYKLWPKYLDCIQNKANCYIKKGNPADADSILKIALSDIKGKMDTLSPVFIDVYFNLGAIKASKNLFSEALFYYQRAEILANNINRYNDKSMIRVFNAIGNVYYSLGNFDLAKKYFFSGLRLSQQIFGENSINAARFHNNIGIAYAELIEIDSALMQYSIVNEIFNDQLAKNHPYFAMVYNAIGNIFIDKGEYDLAIQYFKKALAVMNANNIDFNSQSIDYYISIAIAYRHKSEPAIALEYYMSILQKAIEIWGEKSVKVADIYMNMGNNYDILNDFDNALNYKIKSLNIYKEIFGDTHMYVFRAYNNIANTYGNSEKYQEALEFQNKSLNLVTELMGVKSYHSAVCYKNMAEIYTRMDKFHQAEDYALKALEIRKNILGLKHPQVASTYLALANIYVGLKDYNKALIFTQKAIISNNKSFNDSLNVFSNPKIENYMDRFTFLEALIYKAYILSIKEFNMDSVSYQKRLEFAYKTYCAADTLLNQIRRESSSKDDKIALGYKAKMLNKNAINSCIKLSEMDIEPQLKDFYREQAFYFSEKNKASVLLEALAGTEAQKFSGIPDSLLKTEKKLQIDISYYKRLLAESSDTSNQAKFFNAVFKLNRVYDSLIVYFENKYPKYHNLKYSGLTTSIKGIQKHLDNNTAILSYFISDSTLISFLITSKKLKLTETLLVSNYKNLIIEFKSNISNAHLLKNAYAANGYDIVKKYETSAFSLYKLLFNNNIRKSIPPGIKNLVIIPEDILSTIPFEALLTDNYKKKWTGWNNSNYFSDMPFLLKKYNISYSYSTNLYYQTLPKSSDIPEIKSLYDWLALAPVFNDDGTSGTNLRTRQLIEKNATDNSGNVNTRAWLRDGSYIAPLPGSEEETKNIFQLFEDNNKKAVLKTHKFANEEFVKSGALKDFKYLHVATHGMVNESKPELSCILLAQDTSSTEDNILFSGEIYNLELNADLVVLSACETGLGKIAEGEGVIGLTRALLYAGCKNIIVSLWQVSDESTSQLMVQFYKNHFADENKGFSDNLVNA